VEVVTKEHSEVLFPISEAMANLEAEAEAIMEMVGRRDRLETQRRENREGEGSVEITSTGSISQLVSVESRDTPMDVDQPGKFVGFIPPQTFAQKLRCLL
jgi:hypothetical protein